MHCKQIDEQLNFYVDGELPTGELNAIENHLRECDSCRQKLNERLEMQRAFRTEGKAPTPIDLRSRILTAAASESNDIKRKNTPRSWLKIARPLAFAAAAVLAVIMLVPRFTETGNNSTGVLAYSQPSQVVVMRYGERPGKTTPVKFGGIILSGLNERNSK